MTGQKATAVTIQTDRVVIIRRTRSITAECPECGCEVDMVSLADVELITGVPRHELDSLVQSQSWHFHQGDDGTVLICLESLLKSM